MFLSLQVFICFCETKYDIYCEQVAYLHSKLWRWAQLWLELFVSIVGRFLSRVSYLSSYVFLCRSFTSRKLFTGLEKFLCSSCTIWSSLCFWSSMYMYRFTDRCSTTGFKCNLYTQICWLCCVMYIVSLMYLSFRQNDRLFCKCGILQRIIILHKRVCIQMQVKWSFSTVVILSGLSL